MDQDTFELPVLYKGREIMVEGKFMRTGYSYRIIISFEKSEIIFEPDEERNLRAMVASEELRKKFPLELIQAIGNALEQQLL